MPPSPRADDQEGEPRLDPRGRENRVLRAPFPACSNVPGTQGRGRGPGPGGWNMDVSAQSREGFAGLQGVGLILRQMAKCVSLTPQPRPGPSFWLEGQDGPKEGRKGEGRGRGPLCAPGSTSGFGSGRGAESCGQSAASPG